MRAPLAWLRDYVELPADTETIVKRLATLGFPVESVEPRPVVRGVVVGTIVQIGKHPNADRLQLCTIDIGAADTLTIATAATNVAQHNVVPVAVIGAQLPKLTIEPRKMRGVDSQGMLCSADELGLPADWFEDGIMQLDRVRADGSPLANGTDVVALFGLDAPVLDIDVTANRADALSMLGIARELAAGFALPLRLPDGTQLPAKGPEPDADVVRVTLESVDVRRYVAQRVTGLHVRPAPAWMRIRLALAGQRPISNLVDISNFVMLELGQPLHFFDAEKIAGGHIIVRDAHPGETMTTLDGQTRELDPTALLITDEVQATGLAGLMGGTISEVSDTTRAVVIESANFAGPRIRRMSTKLGLRTEASTRNEKNLPLASTDSAAARAAWLLRSEGGTVHAPRAYGRPAPALPAIDVSEHDVQRLLGFAVAAPVMQSSLAAFGFGVSPSAADATRLTVEVPPWRTDVAITADLVEEIARAIGYDRVNAELPDIPPPRLSSAAFDREMQVAVTLAGLGYYECLTLALEPRTVADRWRRFGLTVPPVVEIRNPLSEDQRYMRFSMLPALLDHAVRERSTRPLRTFEIGHVFADAPAAPEETNVVTMFAATKPIAGEPVWRDAAYLALAADVTALVRAVTGFDVRLERDATAGLHPGRTARICAGEHVVGFVGTIDPRLARAAGMEDRAAAAILSLDAFPATAVRRHQAPSKYPAVERDLALIVDPDVPAGALQATILAVGAPIRRADVFDEYRGPQIGSDKKSVAIRVVLQRDDATLTDDEADATIGAVVAALRAAHGAILRE